MSQIIAQKIINGKLQFNEDGTPNVMSFSERDWVNTKRFFPNDFQLVEEEKDDTKGKRGRKPKQNDIAE